MNESSLKSTGLQPTLSAADFADCPRGPVVDGDNTVWRRDRLFWFAPHGGEFILDECPEGCEVMSY